MRLALLAPLILGAVACGPPEGRPEPRLPKDKAEPLCAPAAEPERQAMVVGTIGKLHLAESQYPLARLGDVMTAFKPDLVLVQARVDAFRDGHLEEASFETTYVTYLARQRGIAIEPIDWFREEDRGAALPAVEPWDAVEIERRETDALAQSRLLTFQKANAEILRERVWLATLARARYRGGDPVGTRRRANVAQLAATAATRHDRPRRVLAFVDVFDRPTVQGALQAVEYAPVAPVQLVAAVKEVMMTDVPADVIADWKGQLGRAQERREKASGSDKAFWAGQARVLEVAVDKRGACCVTEAALSPGP